MECRQKVKYGMHSQRNGIYIKYIIFKEETSTSNTLSKKQTSTSNDINCSNMYKATPAAADSGGGGGGGGRGVGEGGDVICKDSC